MTKQRYIFTPNGMIPKKDGDWMLAPSKKPAPKKKASAKKVGKK